MKSIYLFIALGSILLLSGCTKKPGPDFALLQPVQIFTTIHPDKMEGEGGTMVTFKAVLPPEFLVENGGLKVNGDVTEDILFSGIYPLVNVEIAKEGAPITSGFCFISKNEKLNYNPWGYLISDCVVLGTLEEFKRNESSFAISNRDGKTWIASPIDEVPGYVRMIDDTEYDWEKFEDEEDSEYRVAVMREIGKTIPQINAEWRRRLDKFSFFMTENEVKEIKIISGDPYWEAFRDHFLDNIGYNDVRKDDGITLPNGEVRASYFSEPDMEGILSVNPRITPWQKFLSCLRVPLGRMDPTAIAIGTVSSVFEGTIAVFLDSNWRTWVAQGTCQRRDMSELVAYAFKLYQNEHKRRVKLFLQYRGG